MHRVAVEEHRSFFADASDLPDGLEGSDLVVRRHDTDEHGAVADCCGNRLRVNIAGVIDGEVRYPDAFSLKLLTGIKNCLMFDERSDDMVASPAVCTHCSEDRQVVAFCRP